MKLRRCILALPLAALAVAASWQDAAAAQSRSFVVSWFTQAIDSRDGDCPAGTNPMIEEQWRKDLLDAGKSPADVDGIIAQIKADIFAGAAMREIVLRGRVDGKPVNAYVNPLSVKDPHLNTMEGRYAFGFNLDGKGAASPGGFEDPETHEKGVNNQLARALGCFHSFRAAPPLRSSNWEFYWGVLRESAPAWLITISGEDLTRDGEVTVTLDRALEHTSKDVNSQTRADMTYRIDPGPGSHNVLHAMLKGGVVTTDRGDEHIHLVGDTLVLPELEMNHAHLRFTLKPEGALDGIIGGYEPWHAIYYGVAFGGYGVESVSGADMPGMYYLFRRLADADPDPKTGLNQSISATWHIEAVPAFAVPIAGDGPVKAAAE